MGHNEELLKNVREVVERINDLRDLAYAQYLPAVDEVLAGRITDKNQIEHMQRDNFKCCICGASPAKDPSVVLHVDHIIPWSKGGKTELDNLQTLCSNCNYGKSDDL